MKKCTCSHCGSNSILKVSGKCSDMCNVQLGTFTDMHGNVPRGLGIGGGDYLEFAFCTECGMKHDFKYLTHKELGDIFTPTNQDEDEE
jgi:hypothetical protein